LKKAIPQPKPQMEVPMGELVLHKEEPVTTQSAQAPGQTSAEQQEVQPSQPWIPTPPAFATVQPAPVTIPATQPVAPETTVPNQEQL